MRSGFPVATCLCTAPPLEQQGQGGGERGDLMGLNILLHMERIATPRSQLKALLSGPRVKQVRGSDDILLRGKSGNWPLDPQALGSCPCPKSLSGQ